jgi:hypothetical protein
MIVASIFWDPPLTHELHMRSHSGELQRLYLRGSTVCSGRIIYWGSLEGIPMSMCGSLSG